MLRRNLLKLALLTAVVICMLLFTACGSNPTNQSTDESSSQTIIESEKEQSNVDSSFEEESDSSETSSEAPSNEIAKINGGADKRGIYSVVVRLTDNAADKGTVEMVYYGEKGSPQENSIVNTFRIEYYKTSSGTFEISTFFDGEVYQNIHDKDDVTVTNTFDASLRAGSVIISYTPDGGETQEIFREDADYFRDSEN